MCFKRKSWSYMKMIATNIQIEWTMYITVHSLLLKSMYIWPKQHFAMHEFQWQKDFIALRGKRVRWHEMHLNDNMCNLVYIPHSTNFLVISDEKIHRKNFDLAGWCFSFIYLVPDCRHVIFYENIFYHKSKQLAST